MSSSNPSSLPLSASSSNADLRRSERSRRQPADRNVPATVATSATSSRSSRAATAQSTSSRAHNAPTSAAAQRTNRRNAAASNTSESDTPATNPRAGRNTRNSNSNNSSTRSRNATVATDASDPADETLIARITAENTNRNQRRARISDPVSDRENHPLEQEQDSSSSSYDGQDAPDSQPPPVVAQPTSISQIMSLGPLIAYYARTLPVDTGRQWTNQEIVNVAQQQLTDNRNARNAGTTSSSASASNETVTSKSNKQYRLDIKNVCERIEKIPKLREDTWHTWCSDLEGAMVNLPQAISLIFDEFPPRPYPHQLDLDIAASLRTSCQLEGPHSIRHRLDGYRWESARELFAYLEESLTKADKMKRSHKVKSLDRVQLPANKDVSVAIADINKIANEVRALGKPVDEDLLVKSIRAATENNEVYADTWKGLDASSMGGDWDHIVVTLKSTFATYNGKRLANKPRDAVAYVATSSNTKTDDVPAAGPDFSPSALAAYAKADNKPTNYFRGKVEEGAKVATCYNCGEPGHIAKICNQPAKPRPANKS